MHTWHLEFYFYIISPDIKDKKGKFVCKKWQTRAHTQTLLSKARRKVELNVVFIWPFVVMYYGAEPLRKKEIEKRKTYS